MSALGGRNFAVGKELKQSFRLVFRSRGRELHNIGIQHRIQRLQKCSENVTDFVAK
jgi:hypothetical protein